MSDVKLFLEDAKLKIKDNKFQEAKLLLQKVLNIDDKLAEAYRLLGIILGLENNHQGAVDNFRKSLNISPDDPLINYNLACSLINVGSSLESIKYFEKSYNALPNNLNVILNYSKGLIGLDENKKALNILENALNYHENSFELNFYIGLAYRNLFNYDKSLNFFDKSLGIHSENANTWFHKGNILIQLNDYDQAITAFNNVIKLKTNHFQAYNNLGLAYKNKGKLNDALICFENAIKFNPSYPEAYYNLGNILFKLENLKEAKKNLKKAISLNSNYAKAYDSLGTILRSLGRFEEAKLNFEKAISIDPEYAEAFNNLGIAYKDLMDFEKAENSYKKAISLNPNYAQAYYNLGFVLVNQHKFESGYKLFDWRWKTDQRIGEKFFSKKPMWNGESDKNILVWKEQGIGDEIMFGTILNELYSKSKNLIVYCDKRLIPLFRRSLPPGITYFSDKDLIVDESYDMHIPIGSLPYFFRKNLDDFKSASLGYLKADKKRVLELRKLISNSSQKIIGISWYTKSPNSLASFRNIKLKQIASTLTSLNYKLINLQYGDTSSEITHLKDETGIDIMNLNEIDKYNDIDGLAALISACDFVVSTTNITVHLSAALSKETRVLLPLNPDARWDFRGKKTYWYDSVHLYRQLKIGDWTQPLEDLKLDLLL